MGLPTFTQRSIGLELTQHHFLHHSKQKFMLVSLGALLTLFCFNAHETEASKAQ